MSSSEASEIDELIEGDSGNWDSCELRKFV